MTKANVLKITGKTLKFNAETTQAITEAVNAYTPDNDGQASDLATGEGGATVDTGVLRKQ